MFEKKKGIYDKFFKEYQNALYSSNIYNKINHIKNTSLKAKKGNMGVRFNTKIFPNIKGNEMRKVYSAQEIMIIYNTLRNMF